MICEQEEGPFADVLRWPVEQPFFRVDVLVEEVSLHVEEVASATCLEDDDSEVLVVKVSVFFPIDDPFNALLGFLLLG